MPSAQQQFFPFLDEQFPELAARYRSRYERSPYLRGAYAERLRETVREVRRENGLAAAPEPGPAEPPPQLRLFDP